MSHTRTPYCFQSNYASSAYSGPSTSFRPSFETSGTSNPPSHCDTNEYHSAFPNDHRLPRSSSVSSSDFDSYHNRTTTGRPANLEAYVTSRLGRLAYSEERLGAFAEEDEDRALSEEQHSEDSVNSRWKSFILEATSTIKNGYKKSIYSTRAPGKDGDLDTTEQERLFNSENHRCGVYFLAQVDKKIYDAAKAAKKIAGRSGNFILGKKNRSKSERWQRKLNKSYGVIQTEQKIQSS